MEHLLVELECPICTDYLTVPIRQCATGHSVCGKCIKKLDRCALCQDAFTDSRNITLEGLALKMKYPCVNKDAGCPELLTYSDREKHELRCSFKGFQTHCAMKGCGFVGDAISLKSHWVSKKTGSKIFQTTNSSSTKLRSDSFYVNLTEGFGELFWFKCKTFNNNLYFAMQLIGKPDKANHFNFQIEISRAGLSMKKIILGDYCQSIELCDDELFKEDKCCSIGFGNLSSFITNEFLNYSLRLYQVREFAPAAVKNNPKNFNQQKNNSGNTNAHAKVPISNHQSNKHRQKDGGNHKKGQSDHSGKHNEKYNAKK